MSYNITNSEYLRGKLKIKRSDAVALAEKYEDDLAEGNFLTESLDLRGDPEEMLVIEDFWWYGEHSGRGFEGVLPAILAKTKGEAVILFVWEGGDSQNALKVSDGKVTKKKVRAEIGD